MTDAQKQPKKPPKLPLTKTIQFYFHPPTGYESYVREHNKRLRRLYKEAKGEELDEPNDSYES